MVNPVQWAHSGISHSNQLGGSGMCYPVYEMVHVKDLLLLIAKRVVHKVATADFSRYLSDP